MSQIVPSQDAARASEIELSLYGRNLAAVHLQASPNCAQFRVTEGSICAIASGRAIKIAQAIDPNEFEIEAGFKGTRMLASSLTSSRSERDLLTSSFLATRLAQTDFRLDLNTKSTKGPKDICTSILKFTDGSETICDLCFQAQYLSAYLPDRSFSMRTYYANSIEGHFVPARQKEFLSRELFLSLFLETRALFHPQIKSIIADLHMPAHMELMRPFLFVNHWQGGAKFHQDFRTGGSSVVFAQMYGRSAWLAIPRNELILQIKEFLGSRRGTEELRHEYYNSNSTHRALGLTKCLPPSGFIDTIATLSLQEIGHMLLDTDDFALGFTILNCLPSFTKGLIRAGYLLVLTPGDVLVVPSLSKDQACWHSVFGIDRDFSIGTSWQLTQISHE